MNCNSLIRDQNRAWLGPPNVSHHDLAWAQRAPAGFFCHCMKATIHSVVQRQQQGISTHRRGGEFPQDLTCRPQHNGGVWWIKMCEE